MARRAGLIPLDDVLEQLDSDDEFVAEDSDDNLEMDGYYSYDSDNSEEGIYYYYIYLKIIIIVKLNSNSIQK